MPKVLIYPTRSDSDFGRGAAAAPGGPGGTSATCAPGHTGLAPRSGARRCSARRAERSRSRASPYVQVAGRQLPMLPPAGILGSLNSKFPLGCAPALGSGDVGRRPATSSLTGGPRAAPAPYGAAERSASHPDTERVIPGSTRAPAPPHRAPVVAEGFYLGVLSFKKVSRSPRMSDDEDKICPLCCEELDISDQNFLPCKCGYQARPAASDALADPRGRARARARAGGGAFSVARRCACGAGTISRRT